MPRAPNSQLFQPVRDVADIAKELGVTHQRVQFLIASALKKLRRELERRGIKDAKATLPD